MLKHYLSTIARALKDFDNNNNTPMCFYKMLAWEGLYQTPYWNKLLPVIKTYFENTIDSYNDTQNITPCISY